MIGMIGTEALSPYHTDDDKRDHRSGREDFENVDDADMNVTHMRDGHVAEPEGRFTITETGNSEVTGKRVRQPSEGHCKLLKRVSE